MELPSFSKPVPEDWVTIEDHFHLVYALNVSFLDPVTLLAPDALADDGILNLVLGTIHLGRRHFLGERAKLYIPSTINICKKLLSAAVWADKNELVFDRIA